MDIQQPTTLAESRKAPRALQIDHKTGGGGKHRKSEGWKYRTNLHKIPTELLRKQFQLLCANCHAIKTYIARQDSIKP
jgi:hypothetical protein